MRFSVTNLQQRIRQRCMQLRWRQRREGIGGLIGIPLRRLLQSGSPFVRWAIDLQQVSFGSSIESFIRYLQASDIVEVRRKR
ncbi:unnamed protein product [Linum trigynum]|uniref:Uncharacterized protein n=1 Tax=Linum trigynum TaxID=586398 RepID=A0AAV2E6Z9_9ROSI